MELGPSLTLGGGGVQAYFGKGNFGEGKFWCKILNAMGKLGQIFQIMGNSGIELGTSNLDGILLQLSYLLSLLRTYLLSLLLTCETGFKVKT